MQAQGVKEPWSRKQGSSRAAVAARATGCATVRCGVGCSCMPWHVGLCSISSHGWHPGACVQQPRGAGLQGSSRMGRSKLMHPLSSCAAGRRCVIASLLCTVTQPRQLSQQQVAAEVRATATNSIALVLRGPWRPAVRVSLLFSPRPHQTAPVHTAANCPPQPPKQQQQTVPAPEAMGCRACLPASQTAEEMARLLAYLCCSGCACRKRSCEVICSSQQTCWRACSANKGLVWQTRPWVILRRLCPLHQRLGHSKPAPSATLTHGLTPDTCQPSTTDVIHPQQMVIRYEHLPSAQYPSPRI